MVKSDEDKQALDVISEANKYVLEDSELAGIGSLSDALHLLDNLGGAESFDDYGNGFEVLDNKDRLIDNPMVILEWRFSKSKEYGSDFVSALVVTKGGEKFILNDGSTGICKQLTHVRDARVKAGRPNPQAGLLVSKGLRKSTYEASDKDGNPILNADGSRLMGTTYYLA